MPKNLSILLRRRQLLQLGVAATVVFPQTSAAIGPDSQIDVAELMMPTGTVSRPGAWQRAMYHVMSSTSIESLPKAVQIQPESPELFDHPFAVIIGVGAFPPVSEKTVTMLRRYLSYGGFLLIDDAAGSPKGPFMTSVRRFLRRLFPTRPIVPLAADHAIYRAFFLLDQPAGRLQVSTQLEGVTLGPITPVIISPNDLSGALDRSSDGRDMYPVAGGEYQRTEAIKLAINLVMYALTSNYKHDQAHVAELLRRGGL